MKDLDISYYTDGYGMGYLDCQKNGLAAGAGYHKYDNYYFFSFLIAIYNYWKTKDLSFNIEVNEYSFEDLNNFFLNKIGISIRKITEDNNGLFDHIKKYIDKGIPLYALVSYNSVFYHYQYLVENVDTFHGILISGYDEERKLIFIRDYIPGVISSNYLDEKLTTINKLQITKDIFNYMWNKGNSDLSGYNSNYKNSLYIVEKHSNCEINNYLELINHFLNHFNINETYVADAIKNYKNFESFEKDEDIESYAYRFRRRFHLRIESIFNIMEKCFSFLSFESKIKNEYIDFKKAFLTKKEIIMNKIIKKAISKKNMTEIERTDFIETIEKMDHQLMNLIKKCCMIESNEHNLSLKAEASADSEYSSYDKFFGKVHLKAENAISGDWHMWQKDLWSSTNDNKEHWLKLDLNEEQKVDKIQVRHHVDSKTRITREYSVLGSNDNQNWETIFSIKNNTDVLNEKDVENCCYRYFKLFITIPSQPEQSDMQNVTAIYEFNLFSYRE